MPKKLLIALLKNKLLTSSGFRRKFVGDVHEESCYQNQRDSNLRDSINCPKVVHFSNSFSNQTVNNKNIVPKRRFNVNIIKSDRFCGSLMFGPTNTNIYSAADRLIDNPENALSQGFEENSSITNYSSRAFGGFQYEQ